MYCTVCAGGGAALLSLLPHPWMIPEPEEEVSETTVEEEPQIGRDIFEAAFGVRPPL